MTVELRFLPKAPGAVRACKGERLVMLLVVEEVRFLVELFVAMLAGELGIEVNPRVVSQSVIRGKVEMALRALVADFPSVRGVHHLLVLL